MRLINIYNHKRDIYVFWRDDAGTLKITKQVGFYPYYYELDPHGTFKSFKGESLKRQIVSEPKDINHNRSIEAYEADILFTKRFLIDKVDAIEKCPIKVGFIDIEINAPELPNVQTARYAISCISVYNYLSKSVQTFFLPEFKSEYEMMEAFIAYLQKEKFDILAGWNFTKFDFPYLCNRFPEFAEKISPINKTRYGDGSVYYPAGISIIDYCLWFQKITLNREKMYTLDYIAQKHLKFPPKPKIDFTVLNQALKEHNIYDVKCLAELEDSKKLFEYYDAIRRLTKVEWEDLHFNSRMIDMLLLEEAKLKHVALPMKPSEERGTLEDETEFEGAFREIYATGRFENVYKVDIASAYPYSIISFCLDPANISDCNKDCININNVWFKQNPDALLPSVTKKLITLKKEIGNQKNNTPVNDPNYKDIKQKYDAIKTVVNSAFGVMGNRFFRLYDQRVAGGITFIVRSLLHYTKEKLEAKGCKVVYIDTDGIFYTADKDYVDYLNQVIQDWAKETFNKDHVDIVFESEGVYSKILLLALCRYYGIMNKYNGEVETEIKGVEMKRKDSTNYLVTFQKTLINKILDNEPKDKIFDWLKNEIANFKNQKLIDISFPCKISKSSEDYKSKPIFVRAVENTKEFTPKTGDSFYYIFMEGHTEDGKEMVKAFDEDHLEHINKEEVDWQRLLERNIIMKLTVIFTAMNWNLLEIYTPPPTSKICDTCLKDKTMGRFPDKGNTCKICLKNADKPVKEQTIRKRAKRALNSCISEAKQGVEPEKEVSIPPTWTQKEWDFTQPIDNKEVKEDKTDDKR